jgi:hypothetical protein
VVPLGKLVGKGEPGGGRHPLLRIAETLRGLKKFEIRNSKFEIVAFS